MAKTFTVKARFVAEDKASGTIAKVEGRFKRLTSTIKSSALAQVAALGGVAVALRGLTKFISSSIEKANEQEVAVNQLNAALSTLGPTAAGVSQRLQEQASALQKVTTFGDETIIKVQTMIASFVKNEDAIKRATASTLDFSTAFGIDLNAAAALVSKSLGSSTNALTRYGIEVTGAVGSTERLNSLIENVAKVAGGRAKAAVNTFAGAMKQLGNVIGDQQEGLASFITQNQLVIQGINDLTQDIGDFQQALQQSNSDFREFSASVISMGGDAELASDIMGGLGQKTEFFLDALRQNINPLFVLRLSEVGEALRKSAEEASLAATEQEKFLKSMGEIKGVAGETVDELLSLMGITRGYAVETTAAEQAAKRLAAQQRLLKLELKESDDAFVALANSMGIVTSIELEAELAEMKSNLEKVRASVRGTAREFDGWDQDVIAKIEFTERRIESLKNGFGDLKKQAEATTPSVRELGTGFDRAADSADKQAASVRGLSSDLGLLKQQTEQATQATDRLVASQGGTRFSPSRSLELRGRSQFGLSPFGTGGGPARVDSNGSINT